MRCSLRYLWNGARHRSLSVIARTITGTRWSGPRFFGLVDQAKRLKTQTPMDRHVKAPNLTESAR